MTISQILKKYHHIDLLDLQVILAHVLQKSREFLITHETEPISFFNQLKFKRLVNKRKSGISIAYLTGHKEFFRLDFLVNKHTLVPRPDTEILVETVISHITYHITHNNDKLTLVDVGTGSGCIPIAINKAIKQWNNGTISVYATDISKSALNVAKQNAQIHNTKITFLHGNLLESFIQQYNNKTIEQYEHLIITANLPYLTEEQFTKEPSIHHEPKSALVAEKNGLALYEELLKQIAQSCTTYHIPHITCFFEIDPNQTNTIQKLILNYLPKGHIIITKDLAGFDRVVKITHHFPFLEASP
ncbi:MAG: peptide chain release factor N(5)-glutamine methyltransferase [Candidatus Magasanikbacteria bacterium]|nr:peptide chain release factor N(5)-glutamine methyltransferase [Candidatus Magasanikbacteria bacterium]